MDDIATSRVGGTAADIAAPQRYRLLGEGLDAAEAARSRGDLTAALQIVTGLREDFPGLPAPFQRGAAILSQLRRFDEAEALLADGAGQFPVDLGIAIERAWVAHRRGEFTDAARRFARIRIDLPDHPVGFTGGAMALRDSGDFAGADALLREAMEVFPDEPGPVLDYAWVAQIGRDWPEAAQRWQQVRERHGTYSVGYTAGAGALRELGRVEEAAALLEDAAARFPDEAAPVVERAWFAQHRRDWDGAVQRWDEVRRRFPGQIAAYQGGSQALRETGRLEEAEALLAAGIDLFPGDAGLWIDHAALASRRRDWAEAARRWQAVRMRFPDHSASYTGAAQALREERRFEEADAILAEALRRFPRDPGVRSEYGWLAQLAGNLPEAQRRWQEMRERHPEHSVGYTAGAVVLRDQRRFGEAAALLIESIERFPNERAPLFEHAWLAIAQRNWAEAVARWERVRNRFPHETDGYLRGAQALSSLWQHDEAETLLSEGIARFPENHELAGEFAWLAYRRHELVEAGRRFGLMRERFPKVKTGYAGGALVLRDLFRLEEAEAMLEDAHRLFPDDAGIAFDHAQLPMFHPLRRQRNPELTLQRLGRLRQAFPDFENGYVQAIRYLRESERLDEADALAAVGAARLPNSPAIQVEYGNNARERADWAVAIERYSLAKDRFPQNPGGWVGLAASLSAAGRRGEAEAVLREATEHFPTVTAVFDEYAHIAARDDDWREALARWTAAQQRFPDEQSFAHRLYEVQLRLAESDTDPEAQAGPGLIVDQPPPKQRISDDDPRAAIRDLVMDFESLAGNMLGCEFGMFQREFGAEPIDLLRWADMTYDGIVFCLENRFEGVGSEEYTELFVNRENARPEYCTRDKRGFMFQRTFIYEDEMPYDRRWKQALRRLSYLKQLLMADLEEDNKIFVYRLTTRNLTPAEIDRLHRAMQSYGRNTLLYVRYADEAHPPGTVEFAAPGLLIGYTDKFKMSADGQLLASPPSASWLAVCRRAHELWLAAKATQPGDGAAAGSGGGLPAPGSTTG